MPDSICPDIELDLTYMAKTTKNANKIGGTKRSLNKCAWTADEDNKLAQYIEMHGPRRWKSLANKAGLKRCGKSCRLRWLNYLRPDIKRGNISDAEEDLILRLHRLLGNRWSLIARRLPGRTDNEIKNYWNAHLKKKAKSMDKLPATWMALSESNNLHDEKKEATMESSSNDSSRVLETKESSDDGAAEDDHQSSSSSDEMFDFSTQGTYGLEWVKTFLELEEDP